MIEKTDKEWEEELKRHGWKKKKGWKVNNNTIHGDYDYTFFESLSEFTEECEYWTNEDYETAVTFEDAVEVTSDWIRDAKRDDDA